METGYNPHISVDCVIFGFDGEELKILLIKRSPLDIGKYKLPGDLIIKKEELKEAARRILEQFTGLQNIFLKQFAVFDDPKRLNPKEDLDWLQGYSKASIERVITVAYYSLIKIDSSKETKLSREFGAEWFGIKDVPQLIFDHGTILQKAVKALKKEFLTDPLCFELLPKKFSLNRLQKICEVILDLKLDNRNFRKKALKLGYVKPLEEKQKDVKHKPARLFIFDKVAFEEMELRNTGLII